MACNDLNAIIQGDNCSNNSGGIFSAYIVDQNKVTGYTGDTTSWEATITLSGASKLNKFEFRRNVGSTSTTPTIDLVNGSTFYQNNATLAFHLREASKSRALNILGEGQRYLTIIIKDANNKYWLYQYMQLNGGDETSGTARADGSKYEVTFTGEAENRPMEVSESLVLSLLV